MQRRFGAFRQLSARMKSRLPSSRDIKRMAELARKEGINISIHPGGRIDIFHDRKNVEGDADAALKQWEIGVSGDA